MLPELEKAGRVRRPFLGVRGREARDGVLVEAVQAGTPAALRRASAAATARRSTSATAASSCSAATCSRSIGVADASGRMDDVHAALGSLRPGQKVELELKRDGKPVKATAELGERPGGTAAE